MSSNNIRYKGTSYRGAAAIVPNNANNLADPVSAIHAGGAGTIHLVTAAGDEVTFTVQAGEILPVATCKVFATGTSASSLVGLK